MLANPSNPSTSVSTLVEESSSSSQISNPAGGVDNEEKGEPELPTPIVPDSADTPTFKIPALPQQNKPAKKKARQNSAKSEAPDLTSTTASEVDAEFPILDHSENQVSASVTSANDGNAEKKRSRKQKLETLEDGPVPGQFVTDPSSSGKKGKRRKNSNTDSNSTPVKNNVKKDKVATNAKVRADAKKTNPSVPVKTVSALVSRPKKVSGSQGQVQVDTQVILPSDNDSKIFQIPADSDAIASNLSFEIFPDESRGIAAIGPSQVIIAAETLVESGTRNDLLEYDANGEIIKRSSKTKIKPKFLSTYLNVPHFLPLNNVYGVAEPFTRVLRYSDLVEYTNGRVLNKQVITFRFGGVRYERQLPQRPPVNGVKKFEGYFDTDLIIKHPLLGFYSKKPVVCNFAILKKIPYANSKTRKLAVVKIKTIELRRSIDLKNIEIFVNESRRIEKASDVSEMNQQNIQPVVQTASGLLPVLQRIVHAPNPQVFQAQQQPHQFQYVHYEYQPTPEIIQDPNCSFVGSNSSINQYTLEANSLNAVNSISESQFARSGHQESGGSLIILNPTSSPPLPQQSGNYNIHLQQNQVQSTPSAPFFLQSPSPEKSTGFYRIVQQNHQGESQQLILYVPDSNNQNQSPSYKQLQQPGNVIDAPGACTFYPSNAVKPPQLQQVQLSQQQQHPHIVVQHPQQGQSQLQFQHQQPTNYPQQVLVQQQEEFIPQSVNSQIQFLQQPSGNSVIKQLHPQQRLAEEVQFQHSHHEPTLPQVVHQQHQQQQAPIRIINQGTQVIKSLAQEQSIQQSQPSVLNIRSPAPVPLPPLSYQQNSQASERQQSLSTAHLLPTSVVPKLNQTCEKPKKAKQPRKKKASGSEVASPPGAFSNHGQDQNQLQVHTNAFAAAHPLKSGAPGALQQLSQFASGCTTSGISVAPKSQISLLPSRPSLPTSSLASPTPITTFLTSGNRSVQIISSSLNHRVNLPAPKNLTLAPAASNKGLRRPGTLAVCHHCGLCNSNLVKCSRCNSEFPVDVKLVPDSWSVDKDVAVVTVPSAVIDVNKPGTAAKDKNEGVVMSPGCMGSKQLGTKGQKKIVLVNTPQLLNSTALSSSAGPTAAPRVRGNAPIHLKVEQQADGGSIVTLVDINGQPVSGGSTALTPSKPKPAPKKRTPRRKEPECISLSSDEEEPEPKPKVAKVEESSGPTKPAILRPPQRTEQKEEESEKKISEEKPVTNENALNPSPSKADCGDMCRRIVTFNFTSSVEESPNEPDDISPGKVWQRIETEMDSPSSTLEFATLEVRSVRIGSYKVTSTDVGIPLIIVFTKLGIKFNIPHANMKHKSVKICIPHEVVLGMRVHFSKKLPVIFLNSGPNFARWIRNELGLDGSPHNESSNYYCPVDGNACQRTITFLADSVADQDVGVIKSMYKDVITEIDYADANNVLMNITPETYKTSIGLQNKAIVQIPVAKAKTEPPTPIAATSISNSMNHVSLPKTVQNSQSPPSESSQVSSGKSTTTVGSSQTENSDEAVLFYEGKNNKIAISPKDITCLGYSQFLNDQIIDFWLAVIQNEKLSEADKKRTFVFDTFFYSKLTEKIKKRPAVTADGDKMTPAEKRHERVKKRTKNVDIFEKDFLVIPINENYHWFIAIICFPGMEGFHDYDTLEPLKDFKLPKAAPKSRSKKPIVYSQPQNESTSSYSNRDEAPADPDEEVGQCPEQNSDSQSTSSPDAQGNADKKAEFSSGSGKKKAENFQRIKHPCILIFDSLAGDSRARIYATLREYLRVEYKVKKKMDRVFDKTTLLGAMPRVPQQPNFSDCGLYMLQYIESFFSHPIMTYDLNNLNLKKWFEEAIAVKKRRDIFEFIKDQVAQKFPERLHRIPEVNFEECESESMLQDLEDPEAQYSEDDSEDDLFTPVTPASKRKKRVSVTSDHDYADSNTKRARSASPLTPVITEVSSLKK